MDNNSHYQKNFRYLLIAASVAMFLVLVQGGITRVTESGLSCPNWPTCFGDWLPPVGTQAIFAYTHRLTAAISTSLVLVAALLSVWQYQKARLIRHTLIGASLLLGFQSLLGAVVASVELPGWIRALHLGTGLVIFGLILTATVNAVASQHTRLQGDRLRFHSPFARLALWALGATFFVFVTGALISGSDSSLVCASWPLCNGLFFSSSLPDWAQMGHRVIVGGTSLLMMALLWRAWVTQRSQRAILPAATVAVVLFYGQILVGALMSTREFPVYLLGLHQATAVAVWGALVILTICVGLAGRSVQEEGFEASQPLAQKQRLLDLLTLTKPIIVTLLLVTTFTGMVVGGKELPAFSLTAWTLLAGALAAGGSGAVNQYIDRELDQRMVRTAGRPIASGRLTPAEGLAFGLALLLISFYLFAAFVNLLAALLSLAGMLYYVLLYSIYLKKATVQNIVIGGGAGAIPPLVGWAAATGSINIPALFLFAIIFLWTPPHFWALALVRSKDYKRAGIPMLPAVRGKKETRKQILLYSLQLVALTLLMPLFGMAGSVFLIAALILGMWILHAAYRVWHIGGNKVAWKLYRYSSMYLAFLFVALIVDALM
ncbi:MAG: protoheme IX farnesyltransferase [Chloroflexi bacterium]|nr:MAG: protoheme IX farnesyltransferase [Chloroflexota bacterium]